MAAVTNGGRERERERAGVSFISCHKTLSVVTPEIFLENNYKIQTISLVRKHFKHISFITIRVQWSRFLCYKIKYIVLELPGLQATEVAARVHVDQKSSSMNSFSGLVNRVQ